MCEWSFLNLLWILCAGLFFGFGFACGTKLFGKLLG
jgi:hypothetical protein